MEALSDYRIKEREGKGDRLSLPKFLFRKICGRIIFFFLLVKIPSSAFWAIFYPINKIKRNSAVEFHKLKKIKRSIDRKKKFFLI